VPFFVAVFREVPAVRLDEVLATIRGDFAASRRLYPGRRGMRLFQRLNYPTHLLEIAEWDSLAEYEQLRRTARYQAATVQADPPARIEYLTRLRLFARMSAPAALVGCVILTVPREHADALEAYILNDVRRGVERAAGLVTHEVYRMGPTSGRLLVVHSWRTMEDLERFRAGDRPRYEETLRKLKVTTERLTNVVAAELSRLDA
jgi:heme-degrading monooxygenase HmoA